jgi:hypothetical protein
VNLVTNAVYEWTVRFTGDYKKFQLDVLTLYRMLRDEKFLCFVCLQHHANKGYVVVAAIVVVLVVVDVVLVIVIACHLPLNGAISASVGLCVGFLFPILFSPKMSECTYLLTCLLFLSPSSASLPTPLVLCALYVL